jgi:hypothetical protein
MKKFVIMAMVLMFGVAMFAEAPKFTVPNPELYVGVGSTIINTKGDVKEYSVDFATNYTLGFRAYVLPKLSLNLNMTRDNIKLGTWQAVGKYDFSAYNLSAEYWLFKNAYIYGGPTYFTSPIEDVSEKWGFECGMGLKAPLSKHFFFNGQLGYVRVTDFIIPENTGTIKALIGYQF